MSKLFIYIIKFKTLLGEVTLQISFSSMSFDIMLPMIAGHF